MTSRAPRIAAWLALLVPAFMLGGALISQYVFGLYPCEMCYWQRWPHWVALVLGGVAVLSVRRVQGLAVGMASLAAVAIAISGLIGGFHAGVEYGWWDGVTSCASTISAGTTTDDVLNSIMAAPLVRCDTAPWSMFGISLAGYNFLLSLAGAAAIYLLLRRKKPGIIAE
ncbi:disulfide bond formation protein B [Blastomonas aquatica]|uniref:Dihydroneopterin aldolase n=1 Tax=Blastomonas aquatica TaxID=1510276 RepID=A0ABQ1J3K1_9SPHN|nr:disulfide bond formation protein B [Blastomonas aquatica]GGB59210.1 dihydroneopterin aldolase [Blastomonas aquatica]